MPHNAYLRIALLGPTGYVGSAFAREIGRRGHTLIPVRRGDCDIYNADALAVYLRNTAADCLINCAGYTGKPNVDACELHRTACLAGNAVLPGVIAAACRAMELPWAHVSSGCIYRGKRPDGRGFTELDPPNFTFRQNNCSFYSGSKALGEEVLAGEPRCYIWRLRIPFSAVDSPRNYLSKLLRYDRLLDAENSITYLPELAAAGIDSFERGLPYGTYHITNPGSITTREVVDLLRESGITHKSFAFFDSEAEFLREAAATPRSNCVLDSSKATAFGLQLTPVRTAIRTALANWQWEQEPREERPRPRLATPARMTRHAPQTVLVTGGAGFIGGSFVRRALAGDDYRIVNLDKLTYAGNLQSLPEPDGVQHIFVEGDIGDAGLVAELLETYEPDAILNFAAESHVDRSIDGPAEFVETNVVGTFRLLQTALRYWQDLPPDRRDAFRFLHVSTDEVYGSLGPTGKFTETTAYAPNSPYSASKAASDHFVRAWHHTFGLPVLVTNCSNNYGPFQFPEKLIPLMTLNAIEGRPLPVYGDGQNVRDWLFVDDHCGALETVLHRGTPGETYNIGGNCERTNLEIVRTICRTVEELLPGLPHHCDELITFVDDRPGHDRRYAIDAGKMAVELGWTPASTFERGIRRTVQWYIDNRDWVDQVQSGEYRRQRLGTLRLAAT